MTYGLCRFVLRLVDCFEDHLKAQAAHSDFCLLPGATTDDGRFEIRENAGALIGPREKVAGLLYCVSYPNDSCPGRLAGGFLVWGILTLCGQVAVVH